MGPVITRIINSPAWRNVERYGSLFPSRPFGNMSTQQVSFERLPVLDTLVDKLLATRQAPLNKTAVVYIHHSLRTSLTLLDALLKLGLKPKNTYVLGKHYSENRAVVEEARKRGVYYQPCSAQVGLGRFNSSFIRDINWLWSHAVKQLEGDSDVENVLILDHGGYAINFVPSTIVNKFNVIGLEKTASGLVNLQRQGGIPSFPLINVANCVAKKVLESPLIAEAVVTKLSPVIPLAQQRTTCGVIGYGAIGKAIADKLLSLGHKVVVYDSDPTQLKTTMHHKDFITTTDLGSVVNFADLIFGCTGQDVTVSSEAFRISPRDKTLISCSTEDREFLTLLNLAQKKYKGKASVDPLKDVIYENDFGSKIKILRGGFPYNFDDSGESVPANDIQLTRALVLAGVFHALDLFSKQTLLGYGEIYALDAGLQQFVVRDWLKYQPTGRHAASVLANFDSMAWIKTHSPGIHEQLTLNLGLSANTFTLKNT